MCMYIEVLTHLCTSRVTWSCKAETVLAFLSLMLLLIWFVFLTSRDLPTSPLFVASSEVEMERVGAGSVWAWSGL